MISIIIPTYNESESIPCLIFSLRDELDKANKKDYEILVMDDDSPDKTWEVVNRLGDSRFRGINRRGKKRGLSEAVIDGFGQAQGDLIGVMDADVSHPPATVPSLIKALEAGASLAVGSRYVPGGGTENWPIQRRIVSRVSSLIARPLTCVHDATSGFFFFRRDVIEGVSIDSLGFKIGLEIFVKGRHNNNIVEIPYIFKDRRFGQSKLGARVVFCYFEQLCGLAFYRLKNLVDKRQVR